MTPRKQPETGVKKTASSTRTKTAGQSGAKKKPSSTKPKRASTRTSPANKTSVKKQSSRKTAARQKKTTQTRQSKSLQTVPMVDQNQAVAVLQSPEQAVSSVRGALRTNAVSALLELPDEIRLDLLPADSELAESAPVGNGSTIDSPDIADNSITTFEIATTDEVLDALREETDAKRRTPEVEVVTGELQMVCFSLNAEEFGVDIQRVQEIIRMVDMSIIPDCPRHVKGMIDLRGRVIPVIDLRTLLDMAATEADSHSRIIVLDLNGQLIGMIVDTVTQVLRVERSLINPPPSLTSGRDHFVSGIYQQDEKLVLILDYSKIAG